MSKIKTDKIQKTTSGAAEFTLPSADGSADQVMATDGSGTLSFVSVADVSGIASMQVFTTLGSQTWTRPTGITKVMIEVQGAGGSGGKRNSNGAAMGGGGGGGYARKFLDVSSISSATIVVGTGGPAQTTNDTDGTTGGDSSWADGTNTVTGAGGVGGTGTTAYGSSAGGVASGGDLNIPGQRGTAGGASNYGGDSHMGTGGVNIWTGQLTSDTVTGYGGGSGGAYQLDSPAGGHGVVLVTEYK